MIHGSASTYTNWGCRCAPCRVAHNELCAEMKRSRIERLRTDSAVVEHGKASTYNNWGCRCKSCRLAYRDYMRSYKRRTP